MKQDKRHRRWLRLEERRNYEAQQRYLLMVSETHTKRLDFNLRRLFG